MYEAGTVQILRLPILFSWLALGKKCQEPTCLYIPILAELLELAEREFLDDALRWNPSVCKVVFGPGVLNPVRVPRGPGAPSDQSH